MIYESAKQEDLQTVYDVVQYTIKAIYPKYYPVEVVDYFCAYHCMDEIAKDIEAGNVSVLKIDGKMVGTSCFVGNHITRVYVLPEYQEKGYGTFIMKQIEFQIRQSYDKAYLDAYLPAVALYEKLVFSTVKHERYRVENGVILAYEIMEKELHEADMSINYDGRKFISEMNQEMQIKTGKCYSVPTVLDNGKIKLAERWEWTSGDCSKGESLLVEVLYEGL